MPRSKPSVAIATFQPSPTGPSTFSFAVRAPSKNTSLNSALPVIWRSGRTSMPGWCIGTSRYESPWWLVDSGIGAAHDEAPVGAVRERRPHLLARRSTHSSPSRTARVWMLARSEPAFGSEKPWHHSSSTAWIFGRNRRFCSSVPNWISVGANRPSPKNEIRAGAFAFAYSSLKMICCATSAPRPPYSAGHDSPTQRSRAEQLLPLDPDVPARSRRRARPPSRAPRTRRSDARRARRAPRRETPPHPGCRGNPWREDAT